MKPLQKCQELEGASKSELIITDLQLYSRNKHNFIKKQKTLVTSAVILESRGALDKNSQGGLSTVQHHSAINALTAPTAVL